MDITSVNAIFEGLLSNAQTIFAGDKDVGRITEKEYASIMAQAVIQAMQTSASIYDQDRLTTQSILSSKVENYIKYHAHLKDMSLKDAQLELITEQTLTQVQATASELYKNTTLMPDEHLINIQKEQLTIAQKDLADRQTVGFDDKKRVEQATQASGLVGMIYASGGDVPTDAWTYAKGKVDLI